MSGFSFNIGTNTIQLIWDEELNRPIGTSFSFLKPNWVATAKHVVLVDDIPRKSLKVQFSAGVYAHASVVAVHPEIDAAILELHDPPPVETPLFPAFHRFTGHSGLMSAGYAPSMTDKDQPGRKLIVNLVPKFTTQIRQRSASNEEIIEFESPGIELGHSGGPMFGQGGGVVGLVIEIFTQNDVPYARATSILSLLDGLNFQSDWHPMHRYDSVQ